MEPHGVPLMHCAHPGRVQELSLHDRPDARMLQEAKVSHARAQLGGGPGLLLPHARPAATAAKVKMAEARRRIMPGDHTPFPAGRPRGRGKESDSASLLIDEFVTLAELTSIDT